MASTENVQKAELNDAQTLTAESDTLRSNEWLLIGVTGDVKSRTWIQTYTDILKTLLDN
jgi:hypothetical protein